MSEASVTDTRQYLTFRLDDETFGLDVFHVREILEFSRVTKVPGTPDYMRGVINLRGSVVPVLDMRVKFGLAPTEKTVNTCIVVVEVFAENESGTIGALVDSVQEVLGLAAEQIEPPPRIGTQLRTGFISGMGKREDRFVMLLDTDRLFSPDEIALTQTLQAEKAMAASNN